MKVYRIVFKEYVETDEYIGGPTYNLQQTRDFRLFSSEIIARQYAEYARIQNKTIEGYIIIEQEIIDNFTI